MIKRYSRFISLVRAQYSGNEHGVVRGMGVVSLVHSAGKEAAFYPIDYRVYAPEVDGKTKKHAFPRDVQERAHSQTAPGAHDRV